MLLCLCPVVACSILVASNRRVHLLDRALLLHCLRIFGWNLLTMRRNDAIDLHSPRISWFHHDGAQHHCQRCCRPRGCVDRIDLQPNRTLRYFGNDDDVRLPAAVYGFQEGMGQSLWKNRPGKESIHEFAEIYFIHRRRLVLAIFAVKEENQGRVIYCYETKAMLVPAILVYSTTHYDRFYNFYPIKYTSCLAKNHVFVSQKDGFQSTELVSVDAGGRSLRWSVLHITLGMQNTGKRILFSLQRRAKGGSCFSLETEGIGE